MNRAQRRKLARTTHCGLCFDPMTQHDRVPHELEPTTPGVPGVQAIVHTGCATKDAQRRARQAEATVANMQQAAANVQQRIETTQRAQAMGLWLPGMQ